MKSKHPILVLILTILIAIGIIVWGVFFNQATLTVTSDLTPYQVVLGSQITDCQDSPCQLTVKPKRYKVDVTKTGYTTLSQELNIDRGDKLTIKYEPLLLPRLKPIEEAPEPIESGYFQINSVGEQLLYLRTPDQGDIVVTTFKDPLTDPSLRVSPNQNYALVWSETEFPPQYFLVDLPLKTKQSFEFPDQEVPDDIKFLNARQVLISSDNQIRLFDLDSKENFFFPIQSLDHLQSITDSQSLLVSTSDLDEFSLSGNQEVSFEELLDTTTDELLFQDSDQPTTAKLYYYLQEADAYVRLFDLDENFQPPYKFFPAQIENQTEIILQSNENYHLIQVDL